MWFKEEWWLKHHFWEVVTEPTLCNSLKPSEGNWHMQCPSEWTITSDSFVQECFYWACSYFVLPWWFEFFGRTSLWILKIPKHNNEELEIPTSDQTCIHILPEGQYTCFISSCLETFSRATEQGTQIQSYALFNYILQVSVLFFFFPSSESG